MKKMMIALVLAGSLSAPTIAFAQEEVPGEFATRGQCEAAIKQSRNEARKSSDENAGTFNKAAKGQEVCVPNENGGFDRQPATTPV